MPQNIQSLQSQNDWGGDFNAILHKNNYSRLFTKKYEDIITIENIYKAWEDFNRGKINRKDVNVFALNLSDNLFTLYQDLKNKKYKHEKYNQFTIIEIKKRIIHKASVKDRVVHRLIYNELYNFFDSKFIFHSYSCRKNKGTHKAILQYEKYFRKITKNFHKQAFVLKFDIQKCFENIDQNILFQTLDKYISDQNILSLLKEVIFSFEKGLPLGNLTSQLFVNIYLNQIDFYIKQKLKINYYIRYADDFIVMKSEKKELENIILEIQNFAKENLSLNLHKIQVENIYDGIDFLGFVHFKKHRILRKSSKKKMLKNISNKNIDNYLGLLKWGNCHKLKDEIKKYDQYY